MTFLGPCDPGDDRVACERCDGEGEIPSGIAAVQPCPDCHGRGWVREERAATQRAEISADDPYLVALVGAYLRAPSGSSEEALIEDALGLACERGGFDADELVERIGDGLGEDDD